ncbi:zeta toxin family protein [Streptomyces sp. NPDC053048]|uniref:zeta toxin family protein n=1 Tax=Streptomyces sp. NPDC053048 TaxID=3365694 RepID=UPI0037D513A1
MPRRAGRVCRDGTVLYDNELVDGLWRRRAASDRTVVYERSRPWRARETAVFRRDLARTDQSLHRELHCEDQRLAVQRDAERAAALAEPVRPIAQLRRQAPGVDYHRLSAAKHRWTFDELIAPSYLSGIVSRNDPRAVYVLGQPEAAKTATARMAKRAMRSGTTRLVGDDFKVSHPDYHQLPRDDPRNAGAAIRADYRAWSAEAEAYVQAWRGDALIEAAPGSVEEFLGSALPFASDQYPLELVIVAVREADSRLATALRYAPGPADRPQRPVHLAPELVAASDHRTLALATGSPGDVCLCHPFLVDGWTVHRIPREEFPGELDVLHTSFPFDRRHVTPPGKARWCGHPSSCSATAAYAYAYAAMRVGTRRLRS